MGRIVNNVAHGLARVRQFVDGAAEIVGDQDIALLIDGTIVWTPPDPLICGIEPASDQINLVARGLRGCIPGEIDQFVACFISAVP